MAQSARGSLLEVACNVLSGILTANLTWLLLIAPLYGFDNPAHEVLAINLIFTAVSLVRGFLWRRLFNWLELRGYFAVEVAPRRGAFGFRRTG